MKANKGFTLIELLAVIVILAIIALIATPIVLNLINKARQGAAKDSAYGVRKAAQLYYQNVLLSDINGASNGISVSFDGGNITVSPSMEDINFELSGTLPSDGEISISSEGKVSGEVVINGYACIIQASSDVVCSKGSSASFDATEIVYNNPSYTSGNVTVQSVIEDLYIKLDY